MPSFRLRKILRAVVETAALGVFGAAAASAQSGAWLPRGPDGGNVYCLVADPTNPAILYAGTDVGVYRSGDGGATWAPARSGLPAVRVQTIAIDPSAPATLYAGTLTPNGVASVGVFKSVDGAASWTAANSGLIDPLTGIEPLDVEALVVDPAHPGVVLAGTRFSDVFLSIDGGGTWSPVTVGGINVGLEVSAFAYDPSTAGRVLAASTSGLLLSTDDGQNWGIYGDAGVSLFSLAADPAHPGTFYAGNVSGFGVLKTINGGAHWTQINGNLPTSAGSSGTAWPPVLSIAPDPANPSAITIGTFGDGVFTSDDGGTTWSPIDAGLRSVYVGALHFGAPPDGRLLAGTFGGGVFRENASGEWTASSSGIALSRVSSLARDPGSGSTLFAGAFDGVHRSDDGGSTWGPPVGNLAVFPVAEVATTSGNGGDRVLAATLGGGLQQSGDGGATWSALDAGLTDPFVGGIAVDPSNPAVFYAATGDPGGSTSPAVFKSVDGGATWAKTSLAASSGTVSIDSVAVNPSQPAEVAAVSRGAAAYFHSADAGATWTSIMPDASCGAVQTVVFHGTTTLLGGNAGVCRSADGGATWSASPVAIEAAVVTLAADPVDPNILYAGAQPAVAGGTGGVFRSTDGGATWAPVGQGLQTAPVTSIVVDPATGALHAGIDGRGVAELSFQSPERLPIDPLPIGAGTPRSLPPR